MMYGRPNHTLIITMERAEGADEGPERSQARTKQRKPSQKVILVCLQHERLSTEVSRDTSRDMAGEVGRDPLLHRSFLRIPQELNLAGTSAKFSIPDVRMVLTTACASTTPCLFVLIRFLLCRFPFLFCLVCSCLLGSDMIFNEVGAGFGLVSSFPLTCLL